MTILVDVDMTIKANQFASTAGITNITFTGAGNPAIYENAFREHATLASVTFANNTLPYIGFSAFRDAASLATVAFGVGSSATVDEYGFSGAGTGGTGLTVTGAMPIIGDFAFQGAKFGVSSSVTITGTHITIGGGAFDSTNLISVTIGTSATIADNAFPGLDNDGDDSFRTGYTAGGAGEYTRTDEFDNWTKTP